MSTTFTTSKRTVRCVLERGTNTEGFLSDRAPRLKDDSLSLSSEDSHTFFKSSSSPRETVYEVLARLPSPSRRRRRRGDNEDIHKVFEHSAVMSPSFNRSKKSETIFSKSDIIPSNKIIHSNNVTNATISDTFEFLFAPVKNINSEMGTFESQTKNVNTKRVNFDFLKREIVKNYNFQSSTVFKSIVNRHLPSFVHDNEDMSSGDQDVYSRSFRKGYIGQEDQKWNDWKSYETSDDNLLTKPMKQISDISELVYSKQDSYLPSNPEGDTYDSHSDMIKIYPKFTETKHTRLQLFNYLHHEESPISQYSTTSDNTKIKSIKQVEKIKCQKIFSKYHKPLLMQKMPSDNHKIIMNQSMEIMKLFHQTLTQIDE